jgi:hypothetical protein
MASRIDTSKRRRRPGKRLQVTTALPHRADATADQTKPTRAELVAETKRLFCEGTGIVDAKLASFVIGQMSAMRPWKLTEDADSRIDEALEVLREMDSKNATEAMLAVQMFGVHNAAAMFLHRAMTEGQTFEGTDANVLRATRLMRLFTEQLEAMAKLKGKAGQQKVTVEHVHVHSGAQAVVGVVETSPRTGEPE